MHYTIVINRPGYLPEADPIDLEIDESGESGHETEQVLKAVIAAYEDRMDWEHHWEDDSYYGPLLAEMYDNLEHAVDFDPRGGFLYRLPDGYVIEATFVK